MTGYPATGYKITRWFQGGICR